MPSTKKVAHSPVAKKRAISSSKKGPVKKLIKTAAVRSVGKVAIKDATSKKTKASKPRVIAIAASKARVPAKRPERTLAVLSPFRFPIDVDTVAVRTARYGGVFFVVVGAIFTLFLADNTLGTHAQSAQVITTSINTTSQSSTTQDPKPQAEFIVNNPNELVGKVQVKVKVPYAVSVRLSGYNKTAAQEVSFGAPAKVSDDTWEMYVDTTKYADGEYKLKALITNQYGTYESVAAYYAVIDNTREAVQNTATETSHSDTSVATTTAEQPSPAASAAVLSTDTNETATEFRFEIKTSGAEKVKMYAKDKDGVRKIIGYAYTSTTDLWKYKWIVKEIPSGTYEVTAESEGRGSSVRSNPLFVKVVKSAAAALTTTVSNYVATTVSTTGITPEADIMMDVSKPVSGTASFRIAVKDANSMEVYVIPKLSLTERYLGAAKKIDDDIWLYTWDSTMTPNGEYKFLVRIKNAYGTYTKESLFFKIANPVTVPYTEAQRTIVNTLAPIAKEEISPILQPDVATTPRITAVSEPLPSLPAPTEQGSEDDEVADGLTGEQLQPIQERVDEMDMVFVEFKDELKEELQKLAVALRIKDENQIFVARERINRLKKDILNASLRAQDEAALTAEIESHLEQAIARVEEDVERIEKVITERTTLQAETDSDKDGVTDYDEIALYGTDPFSADSDGDGFDDGSEILKGYDPMSAESETAITYESPQETGVVREDLFKVEAITPATPNEGEEDKEVAILTGKGLPNSFVTLYIFSTPVVVTLKTDQDGNWNYRFDKELEDGEHQVYVGVTDNAGKIVAKSEPFIFVKEAQAFAEAGNMASPQEIAVPENTFNSHYVIYIVLSISVVAIGLVLILLGIYLDTRKRRTDASALGTVAVV